MYSSLVDESSEHKKAKGVNKNIVATMDHREYKDVLLNNKCLRHSFQSKNHKIVTRKISLSCFNDELYILNNGYDGLALGY